MRVIMNEDQIKEHIATRDQRKPYTSIKNNTLPNLKKCKAQLVLKKRFR